MNKTIVSLVAILILASFHLAEAQQPGKAPRIGFLTPGGEATPFREAFRQGLGELGYVEG